MNKLVKILPIFLIFPIIVGCAAAGLAVGPIITGYIAWKNGEATKYYEYTSDVILRSTKKSLNELSLKMEKIDSNDGNHSLSAGASDRFKIKIIEVEPNITRLSIRINFMGDKPYAELIYKKVDDYLGEIEFDENGNPTNFQECPQQRM